MAGAASGAAQAGLGTIGAFAGGLIRSNAEKDARKKERRAFESALLIQQREDERREARLQPFVETGERALGTLTGTLTPFQDVAVDGRLPDDVDPSTVGLPTFEDDELFQFQREQGERAINRFQASRGRFFSGPAAEALLNFNRQLSGEEARRERARLADLATVGSQAAFGAANLSQSSANRQAGLTVTRGRTLANSRRRSGDIQAGAVEAAVIANQQGLQQAGDSVDNFIGGGGAGFFTQ